LKRSHNRSAMSIMRPVLALITVALLVAAPAASQSPGSASEQSIKAAYLYKLTEYVEWPAGVLGPTQAPLIFAIVGADGLADELREMTRERVLRGRRIVVRNVEAQASLSGVHVLFVGESSMHVMGDLTAAARENSVLVITESGDGLVEGSVINLREMDQRIRFEVSLDSADRSQLKLSARLLAVAARVQPRTR
jgi:hypothetical protein